MTEAYIYKPAKTAMQSGQGKTKQWILEFKDLTAQYTEPLMGWTGSRDTRKQVKLYFLTLNDAKDYAHNLGLEVFIRQPHKAIYQPKSYADNFKASKIL